MKQRATSQSDLDTNQISHELAYGSRQFDILIESIIHPFIFVGKAGNIINMNSAAREFFFSYNKLPEAPVSQTKKQRQFAAGEKEVREEKNNNLSLCYLAPWLANDFDKFIRTGGEIETLSKGIDTVKGPVVYEIRFSRIIIQNENDTDATISINETSNCDIKKCLYIKKLNRTIGEIRAINHDLSQSIMAMNGYYELIEMEPPDTKKRQLKGHLNYLFAQIKKLNRLHHRLREMTKPYKPDNNRT
jgi:hypothetical protein